MRTTTLVIALAAGLAGACPAGAAAPDRFTADVLLRQEGLGPVRISPDDRWVAVVTQGRYDAAPAYVMGASNGALMSRIQIYDARRRSVAYVLEDPAHDAGLLAGPFSPDGRRMAVYRLTPEAFTLGVLSLETGAIAWTDLTPEESQFGRTLMWLTPTELVVIAHTEQRLPLLYRVGGAAQNRTRALWDATASGARVGATYIPSGALRDTRARSAPMRLIRLNVETGARRVLAEGDLYDVVPSPDGRRLAVMEEQEDLQPGAAPIRVGDPMRRRALRMIDLDSGEVRLDRSLDYSPYFVAWRPDGRALLAFGRDPGDGDFDQSGRYVVVEETGRVITIPTPDHSPAIARTMWGEPVAVGGWTQTDPVLRVRGADGRLKWWSPAGAVDVPAEPEDHLIEWNGQTVLRRRDRLMDLSLRDIGIGALVGRGDVQDGAGRSRWTPDADAYWGLLDKGCVGIPRGAPAACFDVSGAEQVVAASFTYLVTQETRDDGSSQVVVHHPDARKAVAAVNLDRAGLDWGDLIEVPHVGPAGEALKSWLLLPPSLGAGERAPLVLEVYVGRTSPSPPALLGRGSTRLQNNPAVLAAGGYAVLMVSLPNPPQGRLHGEALAAQLLSIADRAAETGRVAADRVALMGHSYGGYNVLSAAPHSRRFAAVIASNGSADLTTTLTLPPFYQTAPEEGVPLSTAIGWAETGQAAIGRFPEDADRYVALSPLYQVDALTLPTLLIESDLDRPRFGALFGALYRLNREAAWLNYYGEGHTIVSPANVRDLHSRILDWLGRYLGPPTGDAALPVSGPGLQHSSQERRSAVLPPEQP